MKQKLDKVRTMAIKLYEASQAEKRKQPKEIWGDQNRTWRDLPSESVAVWDAVAICAIRLPVQRGQALRLVRLWRKEARASLKAEQAYEKQKPGSPARAAYEHGLALAKQQCAEQLRRAAE